MHANDYQALAMRTAIEGQPKHERLVNAALGLCGEAGEFGDLVKKLIFHKHPMTNSEKEHLKKELGDVMWYVALSCDALDISLDDVMTTNIKKLEDRYGVGAHFSTEKSLHRKAGDI